MRRQLWLFDNLLYVPKILKDAKYVLGDCTDGSFLEDPRSLNESTRSVGWSVVIVAVPSSRIPKYI